MNGDEKRTGKNSRAAAIPASFLAAALGLWGCRTPQAPVPGTGAGTAASQSRVKTGLEVLAERPGLIAGKNIGLITNPSGVDGALVPAVEVIRRIRGSKLVALYAPEHGVRGEAQAGEYVPFYFDSQYGLPVFSLYGPSQKPQPGMLKDIDAYMRSFDTTDRDKKLESSMAANIDMLLFDVQDIGTRVYTFASTMAFAMQTCAENDVDFVVLDRPNPVNGRVLEGPILESPAFSSFIGLYPIPLRFGLTIGELAGMINERFLAKKVRLSIVRMEGWTRDMEFDETGLPWVAPSPNIPTLETALVYPGQVMLEGTNVSEGRGTTHPFEFFGAPWIDGHELTARLNALQLPGVTFREQWFTPTFSKFQGEACGGCQIHITDREAYRPVRTSLQVIAAVRDLYPGRFAFHPDYFDKVMGTDTVRKALEAGVRVEEIAAGFEEGLREFEALRKPFLLY